MNMGVLKSAFQSVTNGVAFVGNKVNDIKLDMEKKESEREKIAQERLDKAMRFLSISPSSSHQSDYQNY